MAYTSGTATTAVGDLLTILDSDLVANDKWSIYDASAGTNAKTYRCYDSSANVDFYVYVDDNIGTVYAQFELWEGWDSGSHAGTGQSLTQVNSNDMLIRKDAGGYGMCVSDHRFIHIDYVRYMPTYVGQLERFDTSKNMPIAVCTGDATGTVNNPIGRWNISVDIWGCLFDESGNVRDLNPNGKDDATGLKLKTIAGGYWIPEVPVYNNTTKLLMGTLEGVGGRNLNQSAGLSDADIVTVDGVDWVCLSGDSSSYYCLIRKS